jgi:hypothetical protein
MKERRMRPHYTPPRHPPIPKPPVPPDDPHLAALALVHGSSCICHTCQRRFAPALAGLDQASPMRGSITWRSSLAA